MTRRVAGQPTVHRQRREAREAARREHMAAQGAKVMALLREAALHPALLRPVGDIDLLDDLARTAKDLGCSPHAVDALVQQIEVGRRFLANDARPGGVLVLPDEERKPDPSRRWWMPW